MGKKKWLITLLAMIVVGAVSAYFYMQSRPAKTSSIIRVSGNIEVTDAEVSFKISGRVEQRLVNEGQTIKVGQIVAHLDKTELAQEVDLRKAEIQEAQAVLAELEAGSRPEEINAAEAAVERARASLDELLAGSRPQEVAAAEATVEKSKADLERLKVDYERHKRLHVKDVISTREFEVYQTAYEMARAKLQEDMERLKLVREGPRKEIIEQARASLRETRERYALVKKGPRKETIDQARARLRRAREALAQAETRLGYATLYSPLSGIILSENIEPGEYVAPGTPVVTVGDLENVWLRAYINETDLGRVKVGQRVRVTTDTYPGKIYEGHLSFISSEAEFTPKNVQTEKERVKLVYRVKIDLPNPRMELKPGMPADADILLDQAK